MSTDSVAVITAFENLRSAQLKLCKPLRDVQEFLCVRLPLLWLEFLAARVAAGEIDAEAAKARLEAAQAGLSDLYRRTRSMTPEKRARHFVRLLIHQVPHADLADLAFSELATGHNADEVCFNTTIALWDGIDRDVAAGKLDPATAAIRKADIERGMDEIRRRARVIIASQRRKEFRSMTLGDFLVTVRLNKSTRALTRRLAKIPPRTAPRARRWPCCRARRVVGGWAHHVDGGRDGDSDGGDGPPLSVAAHVARQIRCWRDVVTLTAHPFDSEGTWELGVRASRHEIAALNEGILDNVVGGVQS